MSAEDNAAGGSAQPNLVPKNKSSSIIWRYFGFRKEDVDQSEVLCRSCLAKIATKKGNTTNMFHHLKQHHRVLHDEFIATMRDLKRKDKLVEAAGDAYGKTLSLAVLDVCTDESVKQCINGIKDRHVDVLINNAGIGLVGPIESIPIDEMKKVFETNFFGVIRMIKEVMPDMKRRKGGHIIVVSSVMGLQGVVFNDVYAASKFAMEGFCECLAVQLLKFKVTMSMIEPGPVHTEFEAKMIQDVQQKEFPGADADTVNYFKNVYLPSSVDIFETLGQTPDDIARCVKKVIEASSPRFRNLTNPLYTPIVALKYADETGGLSVHAFYHMLFNLGPLMHVSMTAMKYLTCGCLRSRTISPN